MPGTTYSDLKQDDPCWIIVNPANSPQGYWKGRVVEVEPQNGWNRIKAVITDPRQHPEHPDFAAISTLNFYEREPSINYRVIPSNKEVDGLVQTITGLEARLGAQQRKARTREKALMDAIAYATRLSEDDLKEVLGKSK